MPTLLSYLLPQLGAGDAPVAEHYYGLVVGNRWGKLPEQFHRGINPGAFLGGAVDAPGQGDGATAIDHADDDGGGPVALERGGDGQGETFGIPPGEHPASRGAKQRVTSSWV